MENARLHQLLNGVERARAGTVNALIQVKSFLSNVRGENIKLTEDLKLLGQEKPMGEESLSEENLSEVIFRTSENEEDLFTLQHGVLSPVSDRLNKNSTDIQSDFESSLKCIIDSWKTEKKVLLVALSKSTIKSQYAENKVEQLIVQFNRVKQQLEDSNSRFSLILENNMRAGEKVEKEMHDVFQDKNMSANGMEQAKESGQLIDKLKHELEGLKHQLEETNMENCELVTRMKCIEQKNKRLMNECNEIKDMEQHSQDIIEKLTENEERLREKISKEVSERNYLQDCMDDTGQILLLFRNKERTLVEENDNLGDDLDVEIQQNECLEHSLKKTTNEHKNLVNKLENMTQDQETVQESLQQATKKEQNYQQQISTLTKKHHILHYSLEKATEEKDDLREMYDSVEHEWKQFKMKTVTEQGGLKHNIDTLTAENVTLKCKIEYLKKENNEFRENLEAEEEDNESLRQAQSRLEKDKIISETQLRQQRDEFDKEITDLRKQNDDYNIIVKSTNEKNELLTSTLRETEETLEKISKDLAISNDNLKQCEYETEQRETRLKEKQRKIRELELETIQGDTNINQNRVEKVDEKLIELHRSNQELREEIGMFEFEVDRLKREKEHLRRHADECKEEFEKHKKKCISTLQILKEKEVGFENQIIEKDRLAMKKKLSFQDAIDNSHTDLSIPWPFCNDHVHKENRPQLSSIIATTESKTIDIELLKNVHRKSQDDMFKHLNTLEDTSLIRKVACEFNGDCRYPADVNKSRKRRYASKNAELSLIKKENDRLVMLVEMLKHRYGFNENDLLDKETDEDDSSVSFDSTRASSPTDSTTSLCSSIINHIDLAYEPLDIEIIKSTDRYSPQESIRYPPRTQRANSLMQSRTDELISCSTDTSNDVYSISAIEIGDVHCLHYSSSGDENKPCNADSARRESSRFSAEMPMFQYEASRGSERLRRKLRQRTSGPDKGSDSVSLTHSSGSNYDDSDYDSPPDEFKSTRNLAKVFKPK